MSFCKTIWAEAAPLRETIRTMPFNRELADGTLPQATFQHYMLQDSLYLESYSRVLSILSARAPEVDMMLEFADAAKIALVVERELHNGFFEKFGLNAETVAAARPTPTTHTYCNYLLAKAYGSPFAEAVAAILPCFWVYREVGLDIHEKAASEHPYRAWIDTYADTSFSDAVDRMIAITDRVAAATTQEGQTAMSDAFLTCTRFEYMFWDAAWRRETWPL
ncbi:thiaminase II [Yunchengibacter salinarum]|uniref:thiaminase II n=1 Tax=Yunchengibacter salinarum TaxID=3133399 RepID=UPI0035B68BF5